MGTKFTPNKQVVRDLQCEKIRNFLGSRLGYLKYFGLCSPSMKDVRDWAALFSEFHVVERGQEGKECHDQHELLVSASLHGLSKKISMLRGDIDKIIMEGEDRWGNPVAYPFDVVSLDYSGGLLYKDQEGRIPRIRAIEHLILEQAAYPRPWVLFVSLRLQGPSDGELKHALSDVRTELNRYGVAANRVIDAALNHDRLEVRLKIYVPYLVNHVSATHRLRCRTGRTVIYAGNRGVPMMNFQFKLRPERRAYAPRSPQESLVNIINSPFCEIFKGQMRETTLGLPKLRLSQVNTEG